MNQFRGAPIIVQRLQKVNLGCLGTINSSSDFQFRSKETRIWTESVLGEELDRKGPCQGKQWPGNCIVKFSSEPTVDLVRPNFLGTKEIWNVRTELVTHQGDESVVKAAAAKSSLHVGYNTAQ